MRKCGAAQRRYVSRQTTRYKQQFNQYMLRNTSEKDKINENKDTMPHAVAPDRRIRLCRGSDIGRHI